MAQVHNIPRNTKGEARFLYIFTPKALIATGILGGGALLIFYPLTTIIWGNGLPGMLIAVVFGLIGFIVTSVKIPDSNNFELTRKAGGEYIDEIIKRYIKYKRKGNRIYLYFMEEKKDE